ncbi:MAG TPA: FHA domain-containing protein [Acidimicrobiia bacterium]|nr:FHA domain-containing protein [Acidimicrobiia bacterium]
MICRQCGHSNESSARFCSSCGTVLDGEDATANITAVSENPSGELAAVVEELPQGTAVFVVRRGPNAGSIFGLDRDEIAAGRHPDSEIFLDDITVSRRHAVVTRSDSDYILRDAGSLNGTYVNAERVDEVTLNSGDEIRIGRFVLTFLAAG